MTSERACNALKLLDRRLTGNRKHANTRFNEKLSDYADFNVESAPMGMCGEPNTSRDPKS